MTTESLLDLDDIDAARVYGDWLSARGDIRGELVAIQCAIETAHGEERGRLKVAEREYLLAHEQELYGPLVALEPMYRSFVSWRRGFFGGIDAPSPYSTGESPGLIVPLNEALLGATLQHPSARHVRSLFGHFIEERGLPIPASVEWLSTKADAAERLDSLPRLRTLRALGGAERSLRHETLESLAISSDSLTRVTAGWVPALTRLFVFGVRGESVHDAGAEALLHILTERPIDVSLSLADNRVPEAAPLSTSWALVADRITGLKLDLPRVPELLIVPNLSKLKLTLATHRSRSTHRYELPQVERLDELEVAVYGPNNSNLPHLIESLARSRATAVARYVCLMLGVRDCGEELARMSYEQAEDIAVMALGSSETRESDAMFRNDPFPNIQTLSLRVPSQLQGVAQSAVAPRLKTLSLDVGGDREVHAWVAARPQFSQLETLVVRGWRLFSSEALMLLHGQGHEVIWGDPGREGNMREQTFHRCAAPGSDANL